jgi:hypothetical protein
MMFVLVIWIISSSFSITNSFAGGCGLESTSVAEKDSNNNSVSTVSERSMVSFADQRVKCVQYLQSNLNEFMQKKDPPYNKVSFKKNSPFLANSYAKILFKYCNNFENATANPSIAVDEILHKVLFFLHFRIF